ncbi:helix-turn-helix domain-containing protein [Pedobacter glucosidilyticus]|uniref:helix-turn-helix domain-containing protein n=1 Tax=Pedobacter glucosidilyticus TaxID=1122941 RepID=UPI00040167A0|nr:helix-turn-helix domain-containing protein [Pedobacter glucosidilyticus]
MQNPFELILNKLNHLESLIGSAATQSSTSFKYLSVVEAARFLDKTPNALRVMVCKNQIKHIKKGGKLYFLQSDIEEYMESGRVEIKSKEDPIEALKVGNKKKGVSK